MPIKKLYAPNIEHYIYILNHNNLVGDEKTNHLIDQLFEKLSELAPTNDNGKRTLWLCYDRGPIEAYGTFEEAYENNEVDTITEFERNWREQFPDEKSWYYLEGVEDNGYRVLALNYSVIIHQVPELFNETSIPYDFSELMESLLESVSNCIVEIKNNTYNQKIKNELPFKHRTGTINRGKYWDIVPEEKEAYLQKITPDEIAEFLSIMKNADNNTPNGRVHNITADDFFRCCSLGYQANEYPLIKYRSFKDQYRIYADGRTDGLLEIDEKSPAAFSEWYHNRPMGGHPWEVCRGGNSTHISLYVQEDEKGYYYILSGKAYSRSIETIKFFLALYKENIPVVLNNGQDLARRLAGEDDIGIVPCSVIPWYCSRFFPDENILDFINLPDESPDEIIKSAIWKPIQVFSLTNK